MEDAIAKKRAALEAAHPELYSNQGRFVPKLGFAERCSVLAYYKTGVQRGTLAVAFGVNRSTISHICSPYSKHYKSVRQHFTDLGPEEFLRLFTNPDLDARVAAAKTTAEAQESAAEHKKRGPNDPNRGAKGAAGTVRIRTALVTDGDHVLTCVVGWHDEPGAEPMVTGHARRAGWYVTVSGNDDWPDTYGSDADRLTSKRALDGFVKMVEGELVT